MEIRIPSAKHPGVYGPAPAVGCGPPFTFLVIASDVYRAMASGCIRIGGNCQGPNNTIGLGTDEGQAMSDVERIPVTLTVKGVEQVRGWGRLIGLAIVELDVAGVVFTLQGVQVLQQPDGSLICRSPQYRRPNGVWASAAVLPPELADALGAEVLGHLLNPRSFETSELSHFM